jgi:hypothetical protein
MKHIIQTIPTGEQSQVARQPGSITFSLHVSLCCIVEGEAFQLAASIVGPILAAAVCKLRIDLSLFYYTLRIRGMAVFP